MNYVLLSNFVSRYLTFNKKKSFPFGWRMRLPALTNSQELLTPGRIWNSVVSLARSRERTQHLRPPNPAMATKWTIRDIQLLMATTTACLCLLILVVGLLLCVYAGKLPPELLGSIKGIGAGGGFLGIALVLYRVIKTTLGNDQ